MDCVPSCISCCIIRSSSRRIFKSRNCGSIVLYTCSSNCQLGTPYRTIGILFPGRQSGCVFLLTFFHSVLHFLTVRRVLLQYFLIESLFKTLTSCCSSWIVDILEAEFLALSSVVPFVAQIDTSKSSTSETRTSSIGFKHTLSN